VKKKEEKEKDERARTRTGDGAPETSFFGEMREGLAVVLGNRYLRLIAASTATSNLGSNMVSAVMAIFALRILHFSTGEFGLVGSVGALGFLVGVLTVKRVTAAVGLGPSLAISIAVPVVYVLSPLALLG
jgi:Na+/melibiose symporter-like transporter